MTASNKTGWFLISQTSCRFRFLHLQEVHLQHSHSLQFSCFASLKGENMTECFNEPHWYAYLWSWDPFSWVTSMNRSQKKWDRRHENAGKDSHYYAKNCPSRSGHFLWNLPVCFEMESWMQMMWNHEDEVMGSCDGSVDHAASTSCAFVDM